MHKVLGLLFLAGGLAFLLGENAPSPAEREEQVAAISRIVARATIIEPETVPAEMPGLRRPVASPAATHLAPAAASAMPAAEDTTKPQAAAPVEVATIPPISVQNAVAASNKAATADSPNVQRQLARAIQTELKRVGCYTGRLDGSWGERSRDAMATFISRVNASLPMNEPDVFLLSLVKSQASRVCGSEATVASARSPTVNEAPSGEADPTPQVVAARPDPLPGRMSIGGPVPPAATAAPPPVTDWTAPPDERLPWQSAERTPQPAAQMAALEPEDTRDTAGITSRPARKFAKYKKAAAPKIVKRRYSSSRSVQQIFMHPLGRM